MKVNRRKRKIINTKEGERRNKRRWKENTWQGGGRMEEKH